ncbi:MAG: carbohydrate ABC transporter substrate-binding protein [Verrucomicrobia bacterium]|nr:MAG: carbohydrate ABC transporter substrate-binding protein [Verrucomicrobiota bacterium]
MKGTTWMALAFLAVALVFTGDRLRLSRPDPRVLLVAHTLTTASEQEAIQEAFRRFEAAHPGVRVRQVVMNSETYQTVGWRLLMRSRRPPDVYFLWRGYKTELAIRRGQALDMAPHLQPGVLEALAPAAVLRRGTAVYHLPQSVDISNLIWFNRRIFEEAGLGEPAELEQWLADCRRLRERGVLPLIQGNRDLWPLGNLAAEFMGQALPPETVERCFAAGEQVPEQAAEGLAPLARLAAEGAFDLPGVMERGAVAGFNDIDAKVFWLSGRAAQHIIGSWLLADIRDAEERGELRFPVGVAPVPHGVGQTDAMTAVVTGWMVHADTPNPQAAVDLVAEFVSRRCQERFAALGGLSARLDAGEFTDHPLARRALEILRRTPVWVAPPDTAFAPEQARAFYEVAARVAAGRLDARQAVAAWNEKKAALAGKGL